MLTIDSVRDFVGSSIFTAVFTKKDGTLRVMNCRLGVKQYVVDSNPIATAKRNDTLTANNMLVVFDMKIRQYRTLNLNTVKSITAFGITINID